LLFLVEVFEALAAFEEELEGAALDEEAALEMDAGMDRVAEEEGVPVAV